MYSGCVCFEGLVHGWGSFLPHNILPTPNTFLPTVNSGFVPQSNVVFPRLCISSKSNVVFPRRCISQSPLLYLSRWLLRRICSSATLSVILCVPLGPFVSVDIREEAGSHSFCIHIWLFDGQSIYSRGNKTNGDIPITRAPLIVGDVEPGRGQTNLQLTFYKIWCMQIIVKWMKVQTSWPSN